MQTQDEIAARLEAVRSDDIFGWQTEVLLTALDFEHAKPLLKAGVTAESWVADGAGLNEGQLRAAAVDYLAFAFGKADDHRGISAERSVTKMREYLWVLGLDAGRMVAAGYENYGVPKLFVAAEELGVPLPTDAALVRMSQGLACDPAGCSAGCGQ